MSRLLVQRGVLSRLAYWQIFCSIELAILPLWFSV